LSLASALGLDNEIALIKSRGFPACEARTVGGPDGKFRIGTMFLDAAGVRALANRLADRFPNNPYLPRLRPQAQSQPEPKEQPVPDIFRGLTERQVRADLTTIRDEWGGPAKAAQVLNIGKSTIVNAVGGYAKIGNTVMDALYGPEGTTLRAEIRKVMPTPTLGELSTESRVQGAYDAIVEATADIVPDVETFDETPAGQAPDHSPGQAGEDAGSDLGVSPPGPQEPIASPAEPADPDAFTGCADDRQFADISVEQLRAVLPPSPPEPPLEPEDEPGDFHEGNCPAWMRPALTALVDQDERLAFQIAALKATQAKVHRAIEALQAVAA
jgi:hypothetical protein